MSRGGYDFNDDDDDDDDDPNLLNSKHNSMDEARAKVWRRLGSSLFFLDALGGAVFLPILPAVVSELGGGEGQPLSPAPAAARVGLLVGVYYAGRSGALSIAARFFLSRTTRPPAAPTLAFRVAVLLLLSMATYIVCGLTVGPSAAVFGLWWLVALRLVSGAFAASHHSLASACLELVRRQAPAAARQATRSAGYVPAHQKLSTLNSSGGALGGIIIGCAIAGALFSPGNARPTLFLCLAAAGVHLPSCVLLVLHWRMGPSGSRGGRRGSTGGGGGWSVIAGADAAGYATVRGTPGGSDAELELPGRPPSSMASTGGLGSREYAIDAGPSIACADANVGSGGGGVDGEFSVPGRYLRGCKGDAVEAERRWRVTLDWRAKERIDEVLREPQPHFEIIKRHYPHFIHRRARNGCPVWIELPGRIDLPAIRSGGVSPEALKRHYVFVTEYLWGVVEPDFEKGQAVTVLDVQGLGMRDLAGEALGFVKQATAIVQDHYVERSNRMFIVNAPSYFSLVWRVIKPMLNERTQAKIGIINTDKRKIAEALLEAIPPENLPPQYGGTCPLDLGQSEEEASLRAYVASITPSLAPTPASPPHHHHGDDDIEDDDDDEVVEVSLGTSSAPRPDSGAAAVAAGTDTNVSAPRDGRDAEEEGGVAGRVVLTDDGASVGAARRVLGSVTGALGWAGGKLAWRRPANVAHLGDENGFEYDTDQHRWVLRSGAAGGAGKGGGGGGGGGGGFRKDIARAGGGRNGSSGAGGGAGDGQSRGGGRTRGPSLRPQRQGSIGSTSSEEMTVLAIQAAHHSLREAGTKLSPVPSNVSPTPGGNPVPGDGGALGRPNGGHVAPANASSRPKPSVVDGGRSNEGGFRDFCRPAEGALVVSCRCCVRSRAGRRGGQSWWPPSLASVLYTTGTAVREALPVWALAGTATAGGMGATPARLGVAIAGGVLLGEIGSSAAAAGWCGEGAASVGGGGGEGLRAVRGRLVAVAALGILFLLRRVSSALMPMPVALVWLALTGVVAANHVALKLCATSMARSCSCHKQRALLIGDSSNCGSARTADGHSDGNAAHKGSRSGGGGGGGGEEYPVECCTAVLLVDVLGSAAGPLLLALVSTTGWASPFDSSWWFVLCLAGDLWLSLGSREPDQRHTVNRLLDDDADEGGGLAAREEYGDVGSSSAATAPADRFAHFV